MLKVMFLSSRKDISYQHVEIQMKSLTADLVSDWWAINKTFLMVLRKSNCQPYNARNFLDLLCIIKDNLSFFVICLLMVEF